MKNLKITLLLITVLMVTMGSASAIKPGSDKSDNIDEITVKKLTRITRSCFFHQNPPENTTYKVVILFGVGNDSVIKIHDVIGMDREFAEKLERELQSCCIKASADSKKDRTFILPIALYCYER